MGVTFFNWRDYMKLITNYLTRNDCYNSGKRINPVGIQIHTIGTGQNTGSSLLSYWNQPGLDCCVHYVCDAETVGLAYQLMPENYYSWADGGYGNRNLITIEQMESDYIKYTSGANYRIDNLEKFKADILRSYQTCVELCASICKRKGWNPNTKLSNGLYLISSHNEGRLLGVSSAHVDPDHVWSKFGLSMNRFRNDVKQMIETGDFNSAQTPALSYYRVGTDWQNGKCMNQAGAYTSKENAIKACGTGYKVFDDKGKVVYTAPTSKGTQPSAFSGISESQAAAKILALSKTDYQKTGILASITAAQMILESGYVKTDLAVGACNCFGMKTTLSNNSWANSTWDGKSKYTKITNEEYTPGVISKVTADFRKYPCIEDSIRDHSAYLLGAKNGDKLRYAGLKEAKDYKEAITIIKNGGYATDSEYIDKICKLVKRFELDKYDGNGSTAPSPVPDKELKYKVGQYVNCSSYYNKAADSVSEAVIKPLRGTITATKPKKTNPYQIDGKYWCNDGDIRSVGKAFEPYNVKISSGDVYIRSNAGTNYASKGFTGIGTFGIVEEKKDSQGRTWGLLRAYQKNKDGWICLDLSCIKNVK